MKGLKSIWVRSLSLILCTVSALGLAISILGVVVFAELGGTHQVYRNIYEDIATNYGLYAMEMIEQDQVNELKTYLDERGIGCVITKQMLGENQEILPDSQEIVFFTGEIRASELHEIELAEGANYTYNINSLMAVLFGHGSHSLYGETRTVPVRGIVFDKENGYFYYETDKEFYKVEDIVIYQDGVYMDYSLTKVEGEECYYNGFYKKKVEPAQYEMWYAVKIDGKEFTLASEKGFADSIYITDSATIDLKGEGIHAVYADIDYVEYYLGSSGSTYCIQVDWNLENAIDHSLFAEWYTLYDQVTSLDKFVLPVLLVSLILFILSVILLMASTINEKDQMGLLHKAPAFLYTGGISLAEVGLCMILMEGIPALLMYYDRSSIKVGVVLALLAGGFMIWLAIVWLQNMVTRLKCRSFWRTTEFYYIYKFIKDNWSSVTKPFKVIGKTCRKLLHGVGVNIPLFWGGILIFVLVSLIEFLVFRGIFYHGEIGLVLAFKAVELIVFILILFQMKKLHDGSKRVASGDMSNPIDTQLMHWKFKEHGENINKVSDGIALAVEERIKSERFKTELITNVSHDIKTPLTSIINYVDLIKKEDIQDKKVQEYIDVLDRQSARLKKLIEDLMEASKASTGNLAVNLEECDVEVLLTQVIGEFEERLGKNQLEAVVEKPEHPVKIMADGRHMWRVLDNLLNNACKYSLPGSRVYITLREENSEVSITFKNISKTALNIPSEELMERFVRGDSSRNTEGSGLGLSIAQSLMELMHGKMKLDIDGDLFKATLSFPSIKK